jgi:hypothetical protein
MAGAFFGLQMMSAVTRPDGSKTYVRSAFDMNSLRGAVSGDARDDGSDWASLPEARAAAAALASALADGAPLEGCVEELQDMRKDGEYAVSARRVHATDGFAHDPACPAAKLPELKAVGGNNNTPSAMLLTHMFSLPAEAAAGEGGAQPAQRLRLTTLVLPNGSPAPELLTAVFGLDAHVALPAPEYRAFTDVGLGDVRSVSHAALAAWALPARTALRAALRVQRLAAVAACIEAGWPGGFCALQGAAAALRPELAPSLTALASRVAAAMSRGVPTRATIYTREHEAEALEAAGRYMEAAVLYKQNLTDDARNPEARLIFTPPMHWSHYGLALKRAGRFDEALAAYEAGLRALQNGPVAPDTPQWREAQRLQLLQKCITLSHASGDGALFRRAHERIFAEQMREMEAQGDSQFIFGGGGGAGQDLTACITGRTTGRRFGVIERFAAPDDTVHGSLMLASVEELPRETNIEALVRRTARQLPRGSPQSRAAVDLESARKQLGMRHDAAAPPSLPKLRCAACGEQAAKRCAACGGPAYCGPVCQKADWKAHKPACKAAQAAAAGGAGKATA